MPRHIKVPEGSYIDPATGRLQARSARWEDEFELGWPVYDSGIYLEDAGGKGTERREATPASGLQPFDGQFMPRDPTNYKPGKFYYPIREAEAILADIARVNTDDPWQLLRFVNAWGGVGTPGGVSFGTPEPVAWTRQALNELKELMELWSRVSAAKHPEKKALEHLEKAVRAPLRTVSPRVRITNRGFDPVFRARTFRQALYLQQWLWITEGREF